MEQRFHPAANPILELDLETHTYQVLRLLDKQLYRLLNKPLYCLDKRPRKDLIKFQLRVIQNKFRSSIFCRRGTMEAQLNRRILWTLKLCANIKFRHKNGLGIGRKPTTHMNYFSII